MSVSVETPRPVPAARPPLEVARWRDRGRLLDEVATALAAVIADLEATAFERELGDWLGWMLARREAAGVSIAVSGPSPSRTLLFCGLGPDNEGVIVHASQDRGDQAEDPALDEVGSGGVSLIAIPDVALALADPFALGILRRDSAALIWLGAADQIPAAFAEVFADSVIGLVPVGVDPGPAKTVVETVAPILVRDAAVVAATAVALRHLVAAVQTEHAREAAKLALQSANADRARTTRTAPESLLARRSMLTEMREHLSAELQERVLDAEKDPGAMRRAAFTGAVEDGLNEVPALALHARTLVRLKDFHEEDLPVWWMGGPFESLSFMLDHKMRLTLPPEALTRLSARLASELAAVVEKNARRRLKDFNASLDHFIDPAANLGVNLAECRIDAATEGRWRIGLSTGGASRSTGRMSLADRCNQVIGAVRAKDLEKFHVDLERRGFTGRMMQARTAVFGLSFLVTLFIRIQPALVSSQPSASLTSHSPVSILTWVTVIMLGLGFVVMLATGGRKEEALLTEKVREAREALAEKLVVSMERFVDEEIDTLQALLAERRGQALDRLGRGIDAIKEQIDDAERRARGAPQSRPTRGSLAALPVGLRGVAAKLADMVREIRAELAASRSARNA